MRILVVDDNRDILDLVERVLVAYGHDVVIARDGLGALQQEATTAPDVVVLDIGMPQMDGYEVARRIRTLDRHHRIRLIAVTGYDEGCTIFRDDENFSAINTVTPESRAS